MVRMPSRCDSAAATMNATRRPSVSTRAPRMSPCATVVQPPRPRTCATAAKSSPKLKFALCCTRKTWEATAAPGAGRVTTGSAVYHRRNARTLPCAMVASRTGGAAPSAEQPWAIPAAVMADPWASRLAHQAVGSCGGDRVPERLGDEQRRDGSADEQHPARSGHHSARHDVPVTVDDVRARVCFVRALVPHSRAPSRRLLRVVGMLNSSPVSRLFGRATRHWWCA